MANYQSQYTGEQIDAAVQQAQRVPTLEQNIASGDAESIMRMQGRSNNNVHDNTLDPFFYKEFIGDNAQVEVMEYLDSLHSTEIGSIPLGILRLRVNGYFVYVLQNIVNYANDQYTQTVLNGWINTSNPDRIYTGTNMYARERQLINGEMSWTPWKRFLTTDDL